MSLHSIYTIAYPSNKEFIDKFKQSLCYERYIDNDMDNPALNYIENGILVMEIAPEFTDSYPLYELYFCVKDSIEDVSEYVFNKSIEVSRDDFLEEVNNLEEFMEYNNEINFL